LPLPEDYSIIPIENETYESNATRPVSLSGYIPFGIEFRVLRNWMVSLEGNAGLHWQVYMHAANALRVQYSIGLGLKYAW
jgi:hypothetical protein